MVRGQKATDKIPLKNCVAEIQTSWIEATSSHSLTDERSNGIERLAFSLNNNCAVTPSTNKVTNIYESYRTNNTFQIPMMSSRTKAVVKFTYEPRLEDELGLTKGEYVYVVEKSTDGWWKGEAPNGSVGWFPSNYVEMLNSSSTNSTETREAMYQPPSQEIKQPLVSSTQKIGLFDSTIGLFDSNLDGTFPASPDENSTGPLTVENDQAPPPPDVQEDSDGEVECLYVKGVESRKAPVFNPVLSPFNPSTMASHTRINVDLLSKDLCKQQPQPQHKHQASLPVAMPAPQAAASAPSNTPPSNKADVKKAQKAARERARIRAFGEKAPAPAVHTMTNRNRNLQEKFASYLVTNGLNGQFTAPTKETVKTWKSDPLAGSNSPLYVALLQPFLTHSCGYENDLMMLQEMETYRNQRDFRKRKPLAKSIYEAYMGPNAPKEVFLPKKMIDAVASKAFLPKPKPSLYNDIIDEVEGRLKLVHARFVLTAPFKELEKLYN
ncbi:hypothetical protein CAEBREN_23723 [Caenorhabditis brenneri]|uniref:SH3 domain-containing protein n=1 Tax=Caenorhabditis brenneri TaxID=135651 RepID=G0P1A5_CAEBE|nr:hypothetical protein CAEBREN_23723 [Caenorhabditis brenneri]